MCRKGKGKVKRAERNHLYMVALAERFYWQIDGECFTSCNPKIKVKYRQGTNI